MPRADRPHACTVPRHREPARAATLISWQSFAFKGAQYFRDVKSAPTLLNSFLTTEPQRAQRNGEFNTRIQLNFLCALCGSVVQIVGLTHASPLQPRPPMSE